MLVLCCLLVIHRLRCPDCFKFDNLEVWLTCSYVQIMKNAWNQVVMK